MFLPRVRRFHLCQASGERPVPVRHPGRDDPHPVGHTPPGLAPADERHEARDPEGVPAVGDRDVRRLDQLHREGRGVESPGQRELESQGRTRLPE